MTSLDPGVWCIRLYFELIMPFFAQHFLTSKLLSRAFPKSPILCKDKLVEGTKLLGLMTSCHFLKTRKLETENVHLNQVVRSLSPFSCFCPVFAFEVFVIVNYGDGKQPCRP